MSTSKMPLRIRVFFQRLWQPTCACVACMTAPTFVNLASAAHWIVALKTGLGTGVLALLLTLTPLGRMFTQRYGNALLMGGLTAIADAWSHPGRFDNVFVEPLLTGLVSGVIVLVSSLALERAAALLRRFRARPRGRNRQ